MVIRVDIDETICTSPTKDYNLAKPIPKRIKQINKLYNAGHQIIYWSSRGVCTGKDWYDLTIKQFKEWGVKYNSIELNKPYYDKLIDDKAFNSEEFFKNDYI